MFSLFLYRPCNSLSICFEFSCDCSLWGAFGLHAGHGDGCSRLPPSFLLQAGLPVLPGHHLTSFPLCLCLNLFHFFLLAMPKALTPAFAPAARPQRSQVGGTHSLQSPQQTPVFPQLPHLVQILELLETCQNHTSPGKRS